ncbi:probable inactive tRNA-specific adenosine deaminase-like protein 3 [Anopheles albimanus]|uniref:CMP/dCMP-type deaminase domain-containing protein n=1 Tax=Anopheles albimanus TaxID=7167 RepID=A0A182FEQ3_ANOAL|nr:probable inactive tRNA-specific adenosine deaminase-like protein 3 [Anopheles albimanus]XP_035792759.1 probable inactive tRNA-specific adenosine deaminase-like protein 3 [Anopheles albimanus]XP_035792760.1 probable inactive tRNA-specific adenosine deaminase-like protein 3 [Anopheles albimanus]XP_035792761.1 probable inactive tRNA-specific adenosine deaminase-like protein 3 [Anopheles albimanus]XP_035792762.1 probable inactive tRNA-specific adenosine deaminase-like protein 3 [Anopheles albima
MSEAPEVKRIKLNDEAEAEVREKQNDPDHPRIESILADEYIKPIAMIEVCVGSVADSRHLSKLVPTLARVLPLASLQHLKRVNRDGRIILGPVEELHRKLGHGAEGETLAVLLEAFLRSEGLIDQSLIDGLCTGMKIESVPATQPLLRWQYDLVNSVWPCKFHPNRHNEALYTNTLFGKEEMDQHRKLMELCLWLGKQEKDRPIGVCVNPRLDSRIAAIGVGRSEEHPVWHCPMVLIDMVAVSQSGGIWNRASPASTGAVREDGFHYGGIEPRYERLLREQYGELFSFGAEPIRNGETTGLELCELGDPDNLTKYGPYLCTGYDVYLTHEPCIMCAMALTHSRVRRVFYHHLNAKGGALGSLVKLHTIKELNHRYEAFRIR